MERDLRCGMRPENKRQILQMVHRINERAIQLLNGLISFKESILREVSVGRGTGKNREGIFDGL